MLDYGILTDYTTGKAICPATREEWLKSKAAGATGVFELTGDGRTVFVAGGPQAVDEGEM